MTANKSVAQRLGRVLERVTSQSSRVPATPEYGSWVLGRVSESQRKRRIRIQIILTVFVVIANLIGIGVATLVVTVAFPTPSVFEPAARPITFIAVPIYVATALIVGVFWATTRVMNNVRWAIEERPPTREDQRNTFFAPWRLTRVLLALWGVGTIVLTTLYGMVNTDFIPKWLLGISFPGIVVSASCYLFTEFALRPVAAQALEAGRPPRRARRGHHGPHDVGLGSGLWRAGARHLPRRRDHVDPTECDANAIHGRRHDSCAVRIGLRRDFDVDSVLAHRHTGASRARCPQPRRAGRPRHNLVVFDGTELGQLQRGFNSMVSGLRERERVRDLFGRHVGREVAAAAEQQRPKLGGEERHVAVIFVDIIGSTQLVTGRPATEVVDLLNRFFAVIVDEVDRHHGFVNKFEGDAALAVFGAPNHLDNPEGEALAAGRAIARRIRDEAPECEAGIGVAAGEAVAGNVGAKERFEYTVIGEPVNEAARLCELAKDSPGHLLASSDAVSNADETERAHWTLGDSVTLRGHDEPTRLALPV